MRLLPSLRGKKRYLAIRILSDGVNAISRRDFTSELDRSSQSLIGDAGSSECRINVLSFNGTEGLVLCARGETARTRAVLATICSVRERRVAVSVIGISGTVKGAKRFLMGKHE